MNIEGAVALGFAKELAKAKEQGGEAAAAKLFDKMVMMGYERGGALSVARTLETDDVIDPAETRAWVAGVLEMRAGGAGPRRGDGRALSPW